MQQNTIKFENILLLVIILLAFIFLSYAFYSTDDTTIRGVIIGAVIAALNTSINWRFGSSKGSSNKDEIIKNLHETAITAKKEESTNIENVENVENIESANIKEDNKAINTNK